MSQSLQIQSAKTISLFPSEHEWAILKEQAAMVVKTGFLPTAIKTSEQAIAIALKGRELGIPPMQAFAHIHIIQGKPTVSAELMLALIFKNVPGAVVDYIQNSSESCVIAAKRPNGSAARFSFTMEDAKRADLLGKGNWKSYPGAMLRARAIAIMARALFPDAIMGYSYTPEELGAVVDEDGEVISIPTEPSPHAKLSAQNPPVNEVAPMQPPVAQQQAEQRKRTRSELGTAIYAAATKLGCPDKELESWAFDIFQKEPKQMTEVELERFLTILLEEQGRKGA